MLIKIIKFGLSDGLVKLLPFISILLYAKEFDSDVVGRLSLITIVIEVFCIFVCNNIQTIVRIDYFKLSWCSFKIMARSFVLYSLFSQLASILIVLTYIFVFDESYYLLLLTIIPISRFFSQLALSIYQCKKNVNSYLKLQSGFAVTFLLTLALTYQFGLIGWIVSYSFSSMFQLCISCRSLYYEGVFGGKGGWAFDHKLVVRGMMFMPQALGWWVKNGIERSLVAAFLGLAILGNYSVVYQLASLSLLLATAINLTVVPDINNYLSELSRESSRGVYEKINSIYFKSALYLLASSFFVYLMASFILDEFYPDYSSEFLWLFSCIIFIQSLVLLLMNELYFVGESKFVAVVVICTFLLQASLQYLVLIYDFGLYSVVLISLFLMFLLFFSTVKKILNKRSKDDYFA